ncbi:uncharacterized protein LOC122472518 [Prionailurus bengalensis]|uniref:uncharacterized protein LOC122472518 n=1 Tax=Prionailurus bengalensis TaxID=37029 RepID=UPI001CA9BBB9|nr:uncharacterized protein LOC122472518 [Prionailurus bengalensis]
MEDFTEAKSLDIGPIYFFDQMKPKRKIWEKREHEGHFPHLRYTSRAIYSHTNSTVSKEQKEARLSTVAECEKKDEFHSSGISQISGVSKFSSNLRFTKIYRQKNLFEEYKLIAAEILSELGEMLQKYAEYNITFPAGIVNLMNYSWHDLIEGVCKCATKNLKKNNALKRDSKNMTQISTCAREEYHKENHLVKAKKDHPVSSGE